MNRECKPNGETTCFAYKIKVATICIISKHNSGYKQKYK